jgi:hypothetical protein
MSRPSIYIPLFTRDENAAIDVQSRDVDTILFAQESTS